MDKAIVIGLALLVSAGLVSVSTLVFMWAFNLVVVDAFGLLDSKLTFIQAFATLIVLGAIGGVFRRGSR